MNFYTLWVFIPIIINSANGIDNRLGFIPSVLSIRQFVLTLNFDDVVTDDRRLQTFLEIYADNVLYNMTLGSTILNGSKIFTFSHDAQENKTIKNYFDTITINALFTFEYYSSQPETIIRKPLTTLTLSNYSSDDWTNVFQNGDNDTPHILWNVTFQYQKKCQNQNFGFYCDNQIGTTSTTTSTTTSLTSSSLANTSFYTTTSTISDCASQIHDLESQRDDEKNKKNKFFWIMIGLIVIAVVFLLLMLLCCFCWLRERGRVAQYNEKPPRDNKRDRVDIVHPHVYPEEQRVERNVTVRQRTLPPYRPPQQQQQSQQQRGAQGPIDASSNVAFPRTQHSRPYQYPSDDDDWSIPPNEHVV